VLVGAIAGAAITAAVFVAGILGLRWFDSAFSTLELTESEARMSTLNVYLETRSIPAGASAYVDVRDSDGCGRWAASVRISRLDPALPRGTEPDVIDTATFIVFEDSGDPFPEERPGMTIDQVEAELCEAVPQ